MGEPLTLSDIVRLLEGRGPSRTPTTFLSRARAHARRRSGRGYPPPSRSSSEWGLAVGSGRHRRRHDHQVPDDPAGSRGLVFA